MALGEGLTTTALAALVALGTAGCGGVAVDGTGTTAQAPTSSTAAAPDE